MYVRILRWGYLFLSFSMLFFMVQGCSNPGGNPVITCTTSADCPKGYRCARPECVEVKDNNQAPTANAGLPQKVRQLSTVQLDGTASIDPENQTLTYAWKFLEKPKASASSLSETTSSKPSFLADESGRFILELIVTDEKGVYRVPSIVVVEVYGKETNNEPIASAGADLVVAVGTQVPLDAKLSTDPDGDPITYQWSLKAPAGSKAILLDPTAKKTQFTADVEGTYTVTLVVSDGLESSVPDAIEVTALSDYELEPVLNSVSPAQAYLGTKPIVLLKGQGFSRYAKVLFDEKFQDQRNVKFKDSTTLEVTLVFGNISIGKFNIKVQNPNKKESLSKEFEVVSVPKPTLDKIEPSQGFAPSKLKVKLTGTGFIEGSAVYFESTPLVTKVLNEKEVEVDLDLLNVPAGDYAFVVKNPGGLSSASVLFNVLEQGPAPSIAQLNPPFADIGVKIPFSVHGNGYLVGAKIFFAGKEITSKRLRRDQVNADPELDLSNKAAGSYEIWILNPDGQISNKKQFVIKPKDPDPRLDRILPFDIYLGDSNKLFVYGDYFEKGAKFLVGSNTISGTAVTWKSSTYMEVDVDTSVGTWPEGDIQAYIENPSGKKSNGFTVTVGHKQPSLDTLSPLGWNKTCDTTLQLFGNNFIKSSVVHFGGQVYTPSSTTHPLTYIDARNLSIPLQTSGFNKGTHGVYVVNGSTAKSSTVDFSLIEKGSSDIPLLSKIYPSSGKVGETVAVNIDSTSSSSFEVGAIVYLDGKPQKTDCARSYSGTCLKDGLVAELDLRGLSVGSHSLTVANPCGKPSDVFEFLVAQADKPYIAGFEPAFVEVGSKQTIRLRGNGFRSDVKLFWGGKEVPISFQSNSSLITTNPIDFSASTAGHISVHVEQAGVKSDALLFSVLAKNPTLSIHSLGQTTFDKGKSYTNILIQGTGFTASTSIYFEGQQVKSTYKSATEMSIDLIDFTNALSGAYSIQAKESNQESNYVYVFATPFPSPVISDVDPSTFKSGVSSVDIDIDVTDFCEPNPSSKTNCLVDPTIVLVDANKKDYSANFVITNIYMSSYSSYAYINGTLNASLMPSGAYHLQVRRSTGELSNIAVLQLTPPPPITLASVYPSNGFAGLTIDVRLYGDSFCPAAGSSCSQPPEVVVKDAQGKDHSSKFSYVESELKLATNESNIKGSLDASSLKAGKYTFQLVHPVTKKASATKEFDLEPSPDPFISRQSPQVLEKGKSYDLSLSGNYFSNGALAIIGLNVLPTTVESQQKLVVTLNTNSMSIGLHGLVIQNPNGQTSHIYHIYVADVPTPAIGSIDWGTLDAPFVYQERSSISIYGNNWLGNVDFSFNGVKSKLSTSCYGSGTNTYCRLSKFDSTLFNFTEGINTVTCEFTSGGKTYTCPSYKFWVRKSPAPDITFLSPGSIDATKSNTVRIYGTFFQKGASILLGGKKYTSTFISSTQINVSLPAGTLQVGTFPLQVENTDSQTSKPFDLVVQ